MLIEILIADDNALVRAALEQLLRAEPDMLVVAAARDGQEAVDLAMQTRPDVVVMDLHMPVLSGVAATQAILSREPGVRVLMLTAVARRAAVREAFAAGVSGYLLKDGDAAAVADAVRTCQAGGRALTQELRAALDS